MSTTDRQRVSARRETLLGDQPGAFASARYTRITPMKARRVVDMVRGMRVGEAQSLLKFAPQAASETVLKVLDSAIANAAHNYDHTDADSLFISEAYVDEGPTLKRFRPRAQGRAYRIRKRTSHITVIVESRPAKQGGRGASASKSASAARNRRAQGSKAASAKTQTEASSEAKGGSQ